MGYRKALALIFTKYSTIPNAHKTILHLHALAQGGSGDAGQWRRIDDEIVVSKPGQAPKVRFQPTSAAETPQAVKALCKAYWNLTGVQGFPTSPTTINDPEVASS